MNQLEKTLATNLGNELTNVSSNLLEVGVDSLLEGGVLKDIPIIGSVVGLFKSGISIKERFYVKKLLKFLVEFKNIDEEARAKFVSEELSNDSKREKFGETILNLIDKTDDISKFKLYARTFELHFLDRCSYDEAIRICLMIERAFYRDLNFILDFSDGCASDQLTAGELYKVGFLSFGGMDGGDLGEEDSGGVIYKKNKYGKILMEIINH
ncbi:hypothetical protein [Celerinatantimonas yamalensis]|uniref:Uncharacterized protein n=1 Tax=Celerinatantimonas yamalensis TaxID=559956 RepID=A0ABW9G515_9GAMM